MVRPDDVNTDRCPGCGHPGQFQHPMADEGLGEFICQGIKCRVQSFIGREPPTKEGEDVDSDRSGY